MYYVFQVITLSGDVYTWSVQQLVHLQEPTPSTIPLRLCDNESTWSNVQQLEYLQEPSSSQRSLLAHDVNTWSAQQLVHLQEPTPRLSPSDHVTTRVPGAMSNSSSTCRNPPPFNDPSSLTT